MHKFCPFLMDEPLSLLECIQITFVWIQRKTMTKFTTTASVWTTIQEESAMVEAARKNPQAFAALYDRYVQPIYRYLYSRVGSGADAEDLTAQTFLSALEGLARYQHRGLFSAWLFSIARSKAMDYFRRRKNLSLDESFPSHGPDLLTSTANKAEIEHLVSLVGTLAEDERELIRLRYVADLSFREMAALLGRNEDAVKKTLYRLLSRLQSQLEARHE